MSASEQRPTAVERMTEAIRTRDATAVRRLLEANPELRDRINEPVFPFDSPAISHFADDLAMVEVLLDFGADPNRRSSWWAGGFHPLHSATGAAADRLIAAGAVPDACAAANLDRPDLLASILAADPARVNERGGDGKTPLHFARSRAVVDQLLAAGADIDARDVDHRSTPAQWMLDRRRGAGRYDLARYLVDRGAAVDIFLAASLGLADRAIAMVRADGGLLDLKTGQGEYDAKPPSSYHIYFWSIGSSLSPMQVAAQFEQPRTLEGLRELASPRQLFLFACRTGDAAAARGIASANPRLMETLTASDHRALTDAAWNGDADAVALMVELGFDPRTEGHDRGSALHCAAWEGSAESVRALLRHPDARALVRIEDPSYGGTPLGWCCHGSVYGDRNSDHAEVARLLIAAGAVPDDEIEASPEVQAVLAKRRQSRPVE